MVERIAQDGEEMVDKIDTVIGVKLRQGTVHSGKVGQSIKYGCARKDMARLFNFRWVYGKLR